jgi:hypothetical protein
MARRAARVRDGEGRRTALWNSSRTRLAARRSGYRPQSDADAVRDSSWHRPAIGPLQSGAAGSNCYCLPSLAGLRIRHYLPITSRAQQEISPRSGGGYFHSGRRRGNLGYYASRGFPPGRHLHGQAGPVRDDQAGREVHRRVLQHPAGLGSRPENPWLLQPDQQLQVVRWRSCSSRSRCPASAQTEDSVKHTCLAHIADCDDLSDRRLLKPSEGGTQRALCSCPWWSWRRPAIEEPNLFG